MMRDHFAIINQIALLLVTTMFFWGCNRSEDYDKPQVTPDSTEGSSHPAGQNHWTNPPVVPQGGLRVPLTFTQSEDFTPAKNGKPLTLAEAKGILLMSKSLFLPQFQDPLASSYWTSEQLALKTSCATDLLGQALIAAKGPLFAVDSALQKSCEPDLTKPHVDVSVRVRLGLTCTVGDLTSFDKKSYKLQNLEQALGMCLDGISTFLVNTEAKGQESQTNWRLLLGAQRVDGSPCVVRKLVDALNFDDDCRYISRFDRQSNTPTQEVLTQIFVLSSTKGLVAKKGQKFFVEGEVNFTINNLWGTITFGGVDPTYSLTNGTESIKETLNLP